MRHKKEENLIKRKILLGTVSQNIIQLYRQTEKKGQSETETYSDKGEFDCVLFYIRDSVHRDSISIRSNEMLQYAGVYLLQNYSTCFGCLLHSSSGVHQTVTAASGTGHSVRATTFRQRGL